LNSPFPYEKFAQNDNFYGRTEEIKEIHKYASTSNNLLIFSKRRLGKSSLIQESFSGSDYVFIYCDIFDITSKEDFANILLTSASGSLKGSIQDIALKLRSIFKRVIPDFSIDANGVPHIKPSTKALDFVEMMDDFFSLIEVLSKNSKVVIAIDEFQQISTLDDSKIDATFRKYMQRSNNVSFIFSGSKRHLLNGLFEYGAPLYEMATSMELKPIALEDIFKYASKYLIISEKLVEHIYVLSDGETKLIQHLFHILYMAKHKNAITLADIDNTLTEILLAKSSSYRVIFDSFSQYQKKAFKLLAQNDKNYFHKDVLQNYAISKGTVNSSFKQLFKRELIDKEDDRWFIPDRALELWGKTLN